VGARFDQGSGRDLAAARGTAAQPAGAAFRSLNREVDGRWRVDFQIADRGEAVTHGDAEEAYAQALIAMLD